MTFDLDALGLHPVRIPMRHRFRQVDHRDAVLIEGPAGWGEFSPFPEYPAEVAARWLAAALEAACVGLPEPKRDRIAVNVTVPAVDPDTARRLVRASKARTAKVKVAEPGQTEGDDLARLEAVREALGPDGKLRVDANAAWDVPTAEERIRHMAVYGLEYVEQPVATIEEMRRLRREVDVPLAADELIRRLPDPLVVAEQEAADVVVLKVQPLGGPRRALEVAQRCGLPVVVSSALETSVGMAAGVAVAAALPDLPYACGLGTVSLLASDVVADPLEPCDGYVEVRRPVPDPAALERLRPDDATAAGLIERLRSAGEVLT
ncbi:MAG: o-succinylbenzoate synthase [Actinomycetes bacterium]